MQQNINNKINNLKKTLKTTLIKKNILKKNLWNNVEINNLKTKTKKINFYKNRPQHLEWVKKHNSFIKRRYFGYLGWFSRRFILKPLKKKKIKRFKRLNWLYKNNIPTIFYKVLKPSFTKVIKLKNNNMYSNIYKNNDIKINKSFKLLNFI